MYRAEPPSTPDSSEPRTGRTPTTARGRSPPTAHPPSPAHPPCPPTGYPPPPPGAYGGYGMPGYGPPPGYGAPRRGNGLAVAALVLGIAGVITALFFLGGLLGIVGLILGIVAIQRAKQNQGAGQAMAIVGTVLSGLAILGALLAVIIGASFVNSHRTQFSDLQQCLQQANTQADRQSCADQFQQDLTSPTP